MQYCQKHHVIWLQQLQALPLDGSALVLFIFHVFRDFVFFVPWPRCLRVCVYLAFSLFLCLLIGCVKLGANGLKEVMCHPLAVQKNAPLLEQKAPSLFHRVIVYGMLSHLAACLDVRAPYSVLSFFNVAILLIWLHFMRRFSSLRVFSPPPPPLPLLPSLPLPPPLLISLHRCHDRNRHRRYHCWPHATPSPRHPSFLTHVYVP